MTDKWRKQVNEISERTKVSFTLTTLVAVGIGLVTAVAAGVGVVSSIKAGQDRILNELKVMNESSVDHTEMQQFCDTLREENEKLPLKVPPFPNNHPHAGMAAALIPETRITMRKENQ